MKEKWFVLGFLIVLAAIEYWYCNSARQAEPAWTAVYIACANAGLWMYWLAGDEYRQWQARHRDLQSEKAFINWVLWALTNILTLLPVLTGALGVIAAANRAYGPVGLEVVIRMAPIMLVFLSGAALRGMILLSQGESDRAAA